MTTYSRIQIEEQLKGEQIGIQNRQTEIILSLHEDQISLAQIAKYTNLTVAEVENILKGKGKF